jgi:hypothetical protein
MRGLRRKLEELERRVGVQRSNVIATWEDYGRALHAGTLEESEYTPAMEREIQRLYIQKVEELIRSKRVVPERFMIPRS